MKYRPLVFLFCIACTQIADCGLDPNSSAFFIEFNHAELRTFTFNAVTNNLSDSVYFDADTTFTQVQLPVTEIESMITYTFTTDSMDYTLSLGYDQQANIYGEDCPASIQFKDLQVIGHTFDSVVVTNDILTSRIEENIEIYF